MVEGAVCKVYLSSVGVSCRGDLRPSFSTKRYSVLTAITNQNSGGSLNFGMAATALCPQAREDMNNYRVLCFSGAAVVLLHIGRNVGGLILVFGVVFAFFDSDFNVSRFFTLFEHLPL